MKEKGEEEGSKRRRRILKLTSCPLFLFLFLFLSLAAAQPSPGPPRVLPLHRFGAIGDAIHDDTQAFLRGWKEVCSSPIPAILKVPSKKTFLVGQVDFSGPCASNPTLLILGTIAAPEDPGLWDGRDRQKWLYFNKVDGLIVRGSGTVDGKGERWWAQSCKIDKTKPCTSAPTAITFNKCRNLRIRNLLVMNSQKMHLAIKNCSGVKVSGLRVTASSDSPNTDGIHISSSVDVDVKRADIRTGDDCVSIVSETSMVNIRDVSCGPGHGISIGSLGEGGSWSNVSSIRASRVNFTNTTNGFRIKTWQGGTGFVRGISFQNAIMRNVSNPIIIDQYYCDSSKPCPNETSAVKIEHITFKNIGGTSRRKIAIKFACSDTVPCEKILLKNIQLSLISGVSATSYNWKAHVSCSGPVDPPICRMPSHGLESIWFFLREALWSVLYWIVSNSEFSFGKLKLLLPIPYIVEIQIP
ncbi:putative polygalacturonase At1g80170 [Wolffia australiana]